MATSEAVEAVEAGRGGSFQTRSDQKILREDPSLFRSRIIIRGHSRSPGDLGGRRGRKKGQRVDISELPKRRESAMRLEAD